MKDKKACLDRYKERSASSLGTGLLKIGFRVFFLVRLIQIPILTFVKKDSFTYASAAFICTIQTFESSIQGGPV